MIAWVCLVYTARIQWLQDIDVDSISEQQMVRLYYEARNDTHSVCKLISLPFSLLALLLVIYDTMENDDHDILTVPIDLTAWDCYIN